MKDIKAIIITLAHGNNCV